MKKQYVAAVALTEDSQKLTDELAKFNPGLQKGDKKPLIDLINLTGNLAYNYATLRVSLNRLYERSLKDEFNSDS